MTCGHCSGWLAAVVAALLASCGPSPVKGGSAGEVATWQCGDLRVVAAVEGESLRVSGPFGERRLAAVRAASGARWADGRGTEFWDKADQAMLTLDGERQPDCRRSAAPSPWEAARARGAAFRAIGTEPGWWVEVGSGEAPPLRAELDFGARQLEVAGAAATADGFRGATADGTPVALTIRREACSDGMSDVSFPASAVLRVGDSTWRGCGRFLSE